MLRRHLVGFFFVFFFLAPAWSVMYVQAQGGSIDTFSDGNQQHTVTLNSGQHAPIGFELQRNTTVTSASFFIKPDSSGASPGALELDVNQDGLPEWTFNQTGYGSFGQQTQFTTGNITATLPINPNTGNVTNPDSPSIYLPVGADFSSTAIDVEFSPTLTGGFFQTGYIHDAAVGDVNGDGLEDFVLFSRTANLTTANGTGSPTTPPSSTGAAFRTVSYDNTSGVTFSAWVPTCTNATETMVGDLNGDGFEDIINYAPSNDKLCIHFVNTTTGLGFEPQVNATHASSVLDFAIGDFTGNGAAEMVSIRTGGKVHVDDFSNRTSSFSSRDDTTVYNPGTQTAATFAGMLFDYFSGPNNLPSLITISNNGDGKELFWSNNALVTTTATITGLSPSAIAGDFDADGDLDILSPRPTGHRSIENRAAAGWDADNHNGVLSLTNATILDYDKDMEAHLLVPSGNPDGNPATLDGNFTTYGFTSSWNSQNRVRGQSSGVLEPWTAPRALFIGDLDGDGFEEHLVLAGEGQQHGVFISAWHKIGYDYDHNGDVDVSAQGYAGNGSNGLSPLSVIDAYGNLTQAWNDMSSGWVTTPDAYGIQMAEVNLSMHSMTAGEFHFKNVEMNYLANFLVFSNPHISGNLTNALNQQMTAGSGTLNVPFTFSGTQNGSFVLDDPQVIYQDGAPNIALPPTPQLTLVDALPTRVALEWQNITAFGDDLLDFAVYRSVTGQPIDLQTIYASTVANSTLDTDVEPGESWTYWVRSVHNFGVTSNVSAPLVVDIPYPTPKSFVPNVTASDTPNDGGGSLSIAWDQGDVSIVEHRVYVESSNFTSIENLTTTHEANATTFGLDVRTDSAGTALTDGTTYYVAVVGFDEYGNASASVTPLGPVYTRNDTVLITTLEMDYVDFADEADINTVLLARTEGLAATAFLHQDGTPVANADVLLHVVDDDDQFTVSAFTNASGHASFTIAKLADLGPIEALGDMTLEATYNGSMGDELARPLSGASNTTAAFGTVMVELTGPTSLSLDDDLTFNVELTATAIDPTQQSQLANMVVGWEASQADGAEVSNGTAEVRGNIMAISGLGAYDGHLTLYLDPFHPHFYVPGLIAQFDFEPHPVVDNNETNQTNETEPTSTFPDITLPATVDCGTATYEWDSNATDVLITCTVTNPNPFDVMVGFAWKVVPGTPPPVELVHNEADGDSPSLTAEANGSVDLTFTLVRNAPTEGMFPGLQGEGYFVYLTCLDFGDNACDTMTEDMAATEGEIVWTLGEMPAEVVDDAPIEDEAEGAMTPVVVGLGLLIAIVGGIAGVLYMRRDLEDDFDDEDEDDYYAMAMDQPANRSETISVLDLGSKKSLDELKDSGKDIHEAAPEGLAASPSLGSSADAFEFGATAQDAAPLAAEEEAVDSGDEEEESYDETFEESDDGITVDEDGTEWWEDEEGVWWYREEGWEDWAVWED